MYSIVIADEPTHYHWKYFLLIFMLQWSITMWSIWRWRWSSEYKPMMPMHRNCTSAALFWSCLWFFKEEQSHFERSIGMVWTHGASLFAWGWQQHKRWGGVCLDHVNENLKADHPPLIVSWLARPLAISLLNSLTVSKSRRNRWRTVGSPLHPPSAQIFSPCKSSLFTVNTSRLKTVLSPWVPHGNGPWIQTMKATISYRSSRLDGRNRNSRGNWCPWKRLLYSVGYSV